MKFRISKSRLGKGLVRVRGMSNDGQVNIKSQSELDIGGRETCLVLAQVQVFGP